MSKVWKIVFVFIIIVLSTTSQSGICSNPYNNVKLSVVVILANDSQNELRNQGTGFFINREGDIITNLHNINGSSKVNVKTSNGHLYPVKNVLAKEISSDLACLSVDIPPQLVHPINVNIIPPEIGDDIFVIGYAEGPGELELSMTKGIISSIQTLPEYGEVIQIDAAVSPGTSGSPLVNMKGEAIGVTTFGYIKGQNQNFAVSCKQVSKLIHGISSAQGGKPISGWNLTSEERLYAIGIDLYRKGKYNQSAYYFEEAIKLNPQYAEAWAFKGVVLNEQGKYDEAIIYLDKAIKLNLQEAAIWCSKGAALNNQGRYDEAIKAYDQAIQLNPQDVTAWNNKGASLNNQGKYDEAIQCLDKAIELNPQDAEAWAYKGIILYNQGRYDEAILYLDKAIELNPQDTNPWKGEAWHYKGIILYNQGEYDEAIQCLDKAIELNPQDAKPWNEEVRHYKDKALRAIERAIEDNALSPR